MIRRPLAQRPLQLDLANAVGFDATQLNAALIRRNAERRRTLIHNLAALVALTFGGAVALLVLLA